MTEWRDVPGYEGCYKVSDDGQVKSLDRDIPASWGGIHHYPGRIRALNPGRSGYPVVGLCRDGIQRCFYVHRLVALAFLGDKPFEGAMVLHGDGDGTNNRLENLRWGSGTDNQLDAVRHGTHAESRQTHCIRKHPFDAANTRVETTKSGRTRRACRACDREKTARRRALARERSRAALS